MLSEELNHTLTRVGAGTPMGELLRRYWHPIAGVGEFDSISTKPVRLLCENLVLYKDLSGKFGLIDSHCPHRRAGMKNGFVEPCGIRCSYHGWQFDETGQCIAMPYEDQAHPEMRLKEKMRIKAYPVQSLGGMLWAYLGPQPAPLLPDWEFFSWKNGFVQVSTATIPCNWLQCQENSIDPVHFEWQHEAWGQRLAGRQPRYDFRHEKVAFEEIDHGFLYRRRMTGQDETHQDWTVGRVCLWPNALYTGNQCEWRVPIDDENTRHVGWTFTRVPKEREPFVQEKIPCWEGQLRDANGEFINVNVDNQDFIAWMGQGVIADRTQEHLAPSDRGIVLMRRRLQSELAAVQEGRDPKAVFRDPATSKCIMLPTINRDFHTKGMTFDEIERRPDIRVKIRQLVFLAGQPQSVRADYEAAMGFQMDDGPVTQIHV